MRRKPAACSKVLSPRRGTLRNFLRFGNGPLASRYSTMFVASTLFNPDTRASSGGGVDDGFDFFAQAQFDLQHTEALAAEQRERAMRGDGPYRFRIVVVIAEFLFLGRLLAFHHVESDDALFPHAAT